MNSEPPPTSPARRPGRLWPAALCAAAVLLPLLADAAAKAQPAPMSFAAAGDAIRTHTLANGLQVIVWPDHRVPSVALFNWVHVGTRNERPGTTGLAHFLQHIIFKPPPPRPQPDLHRLIT